MRNYLSRSKESGLQQRRDSHCINGSILIQLPHLQILEQKFENGKKMSYKWGNN